MLAEGEKFQEYIKKLFFAEFAIHLDFTKKTHQLDIGETLQGIGIKYDRKYKQTGNLYIEVAEKTHPENEEYIRSGIFRKDNTWLYVIGDYQTVFLFSKKRLIKIKDSCPSVVTPTSMGFLVNDNLAKSECIKILKIKPDLTATPLGSVITDAI